MHSKIPWFCLLILLAGCRKNGQYEAVRIIGHAGAGLESSSSPYSANSKEAIQYALDFNGANGVEMDVHCSASQTAWLYHDDQLETKTNGSGCINSLLDTDLNSLHYTTPEHEQLVRLEELGLPPAGKIFLFDTRSNNTCTGEYVNQPDMIAAIKKAVTGTAPQDIYVITNNAYWVHPFYLEGWNVYLHVNDVENYLNSDYYTYTRGISIRNGGISADQVAEIQQGGKEVLIFDVRSPKGIRSALKKLPDMLLTDDLRAAIIEKDR